MSHRKYSAPRHGSLGFLPRKRTRKHRGSIRSFPHEGAAFPKPALTAFIGYKAGMTHVLRDVSRPGSKLDKKEAVEAVTIIEAPPMVVVGLVGYAPTPSGLRATKTVWAEHLADECMRRFYRNWHKSKENKTKARKAFSKYVKEHYGKEAGAKKGAASKIDEELKEITATCSVIRVIAHTQLSKLNLRQKKVRWQLFTIGLSSLSPPPPCTQLHTLVTLSCHALPPFSLSSLLSCRRT